MLILESLTPKTARIIDDLDGSIISVPAENVSACTGDAVVLINGRYVCDGKHTPERRQRLRAIENDLWEEENG